MEQYIPRTSPYRDTEILLFSRSLLWLLFHMEGAMHNSSHCILFGTQASSSFCYKRIAQRMAVYVSFWTCECIFIRQIPGSGIVGLMCNAFVLSIYLTNPPKDSLSDYRTTAASYWQPHQLCAKTFPVSTRAGDNDTSASNCMESNILSYELGLCFGSVSLTVHTF